jgi:hypothetical protein
MPHLDQPMHFIRAVLVVLGLGSAWVSGRPLDELPGEEILLHEPVESRTPPAPVFDSATTTWLAPGIDEQMSRDQTLLTVSKGAVFIPTYTESRREPEVGIYSPSGKLVSKGHTGSRILLDSGAYEVRVGSGSQRQQMRFDVHIAEGHTEWVRPTWGGLLVETLTSEGEYFEGQYELIRLDRDAWFGRGRGYDEERLQDIKTWLLPPGIYRLGKVGDPANALRSYITVVVKAGELQTVELIYSSRTLSGEIIAGGHKSLTTRTKVGRNWKYGLRAGGNLAFVRNVDASDTRKESGQFASDIRLRARFDHPIYFGISELALRDNFLKNRGEALSVVTDEVQARTTWVRRLNAWVGPYVRGQVSTHLFPHHAAADTVQVVAVREDTSQANGVLIDTLRTDVTGSFRYEPSFFPMRLSEGLGVNLDLVNGAFLELTTQVGLAAHQKFSRKEYVARTSTEYYRSKSEATIGLESLVNARLRLFNFMTLDGRVELFAPDAQLDELQLSELELDLRISLSRFVELGYLFQMNELTQAAANRYPRSHNLSLRFNLNY